MDNDIEEKIFGRIKKVVAEVLNFQEEEINYTANYRTDLSADSVEMVTVVMALEDEFNETIPDKDLGQLETVGDTVEFICSMLKEKQGGK